MSNPPNLYSQQRVIHHRDRIAALIDDSHPNPIHIQLQPTNHCNSKCSWCAYRQVGYSSNETFDSSDEIPIAKLLEIIEDCHQMGVKAVEVTGGGEPTVHPDHSKLFSDILSKEIDLGLVTNGIALTDYDFDLLSAAKWVRVSVDAGNSATYSNTRNIHHSLFSRVHSNITKLASKQKKDGLVVGVGFVITPNNWREVAEAANQAKQDGASNIRIGVMFSNEGSGWVSPILDELSGLLNQAKECNGEGFTVYDLVSNRLDQLNQGSPAYSTCWHQRLATLIGADQNLYRCCVVAYNQTGLIGSLKNRRLIDLWISKEAIWNMRRFNARSCPRCIREESNLVLSQCIDSNHIPPTEVSCSHVNFI